jgi:hypothetical protein
MGRGKLNAACELSFREPMNQSEPRNPLYLLLLLVSLLFVMTALAYALIPVLEQKAAEAGNPPPPSPFRDQLRENGGTWLLCEVAAMVVVGLLSMGLDRLRALKKERAAATIPPTQHSAPSTPDSVEPHADHPTAR